MATPTAGLPEAIDERTLAFADGARIDVPEAIERLPWKNVPLPHMVEGRTAAPGKVQANPSRTRRAPSRDAEVADGWAGHRIERVAENADDAKGAPGHPARGEGRGGPTRGGRLPGRDRWGGAHGLRRRAALAANGPEPRQRGREQRRISWFGGGRIRTFDVLIQSQGPPLALGHSPSG